MASKKGNAQIQIVKEEEEAKVPTLKELFDAYEALNEGVQKAKGELEKAVCQRSEAVREIMERGGSKGPYKWRGDELTACERAGKYFFRGKRTREAVEVE